LEESRDMALQDREAQAIRHLLAIENAEPATAGDDANGARDWIAASPKTPWPLPAPAPPGGWPPNWMANPMCPPRMPPPRRG
jgi:hypothetical protein